VGKDLRLLFRDRNFLVQTLVVPVVVFGFQLILNPALLRNILSDHRHASVAAYSVGAYVLLCSAFHVLTVEGNTLWLLYTFPRDLHQILVRKTVVWCGFGLLYTGSLLVAGFVMAPLPDAGAISEAATAIAGVGIFAFIVAALGALATDPLQTEVHRKIRADQVYLAMMLAGLFAYTIYTPSTWQRLVQIILSLLLALALWQKVRDRLPYLLDPTEEPPPRVALADGLVAILGFFVLQALGMLLLSEAEIPKGAALLASYVAAGGLVAAFSLYTFWRHKVPRVLHAVGFRSEQGGLLASIGWGLGAGAAAVGVAWVYLRTLDRFEGLRALRDQALELRSGFDPGSFGWLAGLAILAAPVFEEFLFRGLVYRGLRRSWSALPAVFASAFLFAIVHPPVSSIPVFALGAFAALAFERGKRLLAPILAHMAYNGAVVFLVP
jgi:membrane protease YdiL (CAAX protease family)